MNSEERLLGFDAREMWTQFEETWPQEQRWTYLLIDKLVKPLSVSVRIWAPALEDVSKDIKSQDWRASLGQWDSLNGMQMYLESRRDEIAGPYWIVGITLLYGILTEREKREEWHAFLPSTSPSTIDRDWSLLGYDVATGGLLSGLSACGYDSSSAPKLREKWEPHLNKYHLLTSQDRAIEFMKMTDDRVPEHAPFFVFGLYLIQKVERAKDNRNYPRPIKPSGRPDKNQS
jgi:hypothetical protein